MPYRIGGGSEAVVIPINVNGDAYAVRRRSRAVRAAAKGARARLSAVFQERDGDDYLSQGPDFAPYLAVKLLVYRRVVDDLRRRPGRRITVGGVVPDPVTARRLRTFLTAGTRKGRPGEGVPDLFECTPQALRQRLQSLNHGSFLDEEGRGVRKAVEYKWKEPILYSNLCSYFALERTTDRKPALGLDAFRLRGEHQDAPFSARDYIALFERHRRLHATGRWAGLIGLGSTRGALTFVEHMKERLTRLVEVGILATGPDGFRLTPRGLEAAHWFDLFAHSMSYVANPKQCAGCPMGDPCRAGRLEAGLGIPAGTRRPRTRRAANE